jgi:hypothetical protein
VPSLALFHLSSNEQAACCLASGSWPDLLYQTSYLKKTAGDHRQEELMIFTWSNGELRHGRWAASRSLLCWHCCSTSSCFALPAGLRKQTVLAQSLLYSEKPARLILLSLLEMAALPFLPVSAIVKGALSHAIGIILIGAIAWFLIAMVDVVEAVLAYKFSTDLADNLAARRVRTQVQVLRRMV